MNATEQTEHAIAQLREDVANAKQADDVYVETYTRAVDAVLTEVDRLTNRVADLEAELTDEIEWGIGHPEGAGQIWYEIGYTRHGAAHHATARGNGRFPAWRRLNRWHDATKEQP